MQLVTQARNPKHNHKVAIRAEEEAGKNLTQKANTKQFNYGHTPMHHLQRNANKKQNQQIRHVHLHLSGIEKAREKRQQIQVPLVVSGEDVKLLLF